MSLRPREYLGKEAGFVEAQGDDEQQRDGQPRGNLGKQRQQLALGVREKIVDDEHPEQGDGEPVAALRGRMEVADEAVGKVIANQRTEQHEEDGRWDELHPQLLEQQLPEIVGIPHLCGFVGQESADEEEQRHAEQQEERQRRRPLPMLPETYLADMVGYDENHGKAAQRIEPFQAGFLDGYIHGDG